MRNRSKLLLAGLTAALLLSMAVASASAQRIGITNGNRNFRVVWSPLTFSSESFAEPVRCNVTIEGSFHSSTITKTVGSLIGYVTRGTTGQCVNTAGGNNATIIQEALPWHVRYRGFTGTLPNITGIVLGLVNARFRIESGGTTCTTTTTAANPGIGTAVVGAGGVITGMRANEAATIPLNGGFVCEFFAGNGSFSGTGSVKLLNSTTNIIVRLI